MDLIKVAEEVTLSLSLTKSSKVQRSVSSSIVVLLSRFQVKAARSVSLSARCQVQ